MTEFNQFSYPLFSIAILLIVFIVMRRFAKISMRYIIPLELVIGAFMLGGWLILKPIATEIDDVAQVQAILDNGKPTFLEFFSKFCSGCLVNEPLVLEIVDKIEDEFNILRIDIHTEQGRDLREAYGFSFTPEFVIFDKSGQEIWREHVPPSQQTLEQAK